MILTYRELVKLTEEGVIENSDLSCVNGASIDVRMGDTIWVESSAGGVVDLANKGSINMRQVRIGPNGSLDCWDLRPGEFCLAGTMEKFHIPRNMSGMYYLKSTLARNGLGHLLAGFIDPGWHGSVLTLELSNHTQHHRLRLTPGMKIGQIVFHRHDVVPAEHCYSTGGQYNDCHKATPSKWLR